MFSNRESTTMKALSTFGNGPDNMPVKMTVQINLFLHNYAVSTKSF